MILQIDDMMTLEEIMDRFSECFPFLKLEFYDRSHKIFQSSDKRFLLDKKKRVGEVRHLHYNGVIEIKSWFSTAKVEHDLHQLFGLNAQIFRHDSISGWVQTTLSDDLTLAQQSSFSSDPLLQP